MKLINSSLNHAGALVRILRRHPATVLLSAVLILAGLTSSVPINSTRLAEHMHKVKDNWLEPCGKSALYANHSTVLTGDQNSLRAAKKNLKSQINQTLVELHHWRDLSEGSNNVTIWSTEERKRQFKFLHPFVTDETTWWRRLSIYWASLELVSNVTKDQGKNTIVTRPEQDAVDEVRDGIRQLLCHLQVYMNLTCTRSNAVSATRMSLLLKFDIQDASEIKIHIWYIMCRLECFLNNMKKHIRQLNGKGKPLHKPVNAMRCKLCPHENERKKHGKKMQQQRRQQSKQQQIKQRPNAAKTRSSHSCRNHSGRKSAKRNQPHNGQG